MAIDTSIYNMLAQPRKTALDYQGEFEQRDLARQNALLSQESARQGIAMNALQMRGAQRAEQEDQAFRNYLTGGGDLSTPEGQRKAMAIAPKAAGAYMTQQAELLSKTASTQKAQADAKKTQYELHRKQVENGLMMAVNGSTPQAIEQSVSEGVRGGLWSMQEAQQILSDMPRDGNPQALMKWRLEQLQTALSAKDALEQYMKQQEFAQRGRNDLITPDGTVNQPLLQAKQQVARAGASSVSVNTGQKGLDNEFKLRGEFKQEPVYKAHQEMQAAHGQIKQALSQGTPASDLAAATKIMKLLDPGSVVRESELGMAMAATGLLDRATNYAQNVISGNKLTPQQRKDFQALADALYSESIGAYNAKRSEYENLGGSYGLNAGRALGPNAAGISQQGQPGRVVDFGSLR